MRRVGLVLLIVLVVYTLAGCSAVKEKPAAPLTSKASAGDPVKSSGEATYEDGSATKNELPEKTPDNVGSSGDDVILKSETPVADPEVERALQDLEKEIDSTLDVIKDIGVIEDEDLRFPGVQQ
ncbi:MAG: hypothetical protein AB1500_11995 [Bacillota bacterium]